jgi:hypothetical protein
VLDSKVVCMYVSASARLVAQTSTTRDIELSFAGGEVPQPVELD